MIFDQEPVTRFIGFASAIHFKVQRITERKLRSVGLTYSQFGVLTAIAEKDGRTQRELADCLETDANTVMVVCDGLEKKGLARRHPDPTDRRIWRISLTPRGSKAFATALAIVKTLYRPLSQVISEKEIDKALPVLQRLYGHLKEKDKKQACKSANRK